MVKIYKTMEKLSKGDKVKILNQPYHVEGKWDFKSGEVREVSHINRTGCVEVFNKSKTLIAPFYDDEIQLIEKATTESQSKKIKQALRKICLSGLVIKSEKIISKVKEDIGTDYVFGDTILRALRQLRQDGEVNYTADKHSREYTFK